MVADYHSFDWRVPALVLRSEGLRQQLITLYTQTPRLRYADIAAQVELRVDEIAPILAGLIREGAIPARKGQGGSMALTQEQVARLSFIDACRQRGESWSSIATKLRISRQAVQRFHRIHIHQLEQSCIGKP